MVFVQAWILGGQCRARDGYCARIESCVLLAQYLERPRIWAGTVRSGNQIDLQDPGRNLLVEFTIYQLCHLGQHRSSLTVVMGALVNWHVRLVLLGTGHTRDNYSAEEDDVSSVELHTYCN